MTPDSISTLDRILRGDSPFRYLTDADQRDLTVREIFVERREPPRVNMLVFISDDDVRGISSFPLDWRKLDDSTLLSLSVLGESLLPPTPDEPEEDVVFFFADANLVAAPH